MKAQSPQRSSRRAQASRPKEERLSALRGAGLLLAAATLSGCLRKDAQPVDLLFEGDSDIEGWNTNRYRDSANVGVGGAVCGDVLETLTDTLDSYQPNRMVLVCGENDLWEQGVHRTFRDFSAVVSGIHQTGATVYYMGTKPEPETTSLHAEYRQYDDKVRQLALELATDEHAPLVMIDVYPGFEALGNPDELYQRDQLHLSRAGYDLWDEWLNAALADDQCIVWESGDCQEPVPP